MPHQVIPYEGRVNVNYTMFEATRVHPSWIGHNSRHALVIVPTESSRRAWLNSGLDPGKIRVSPLGIDVARFGGTIAPRSIATAEGESIARYRTRFLNISELSPRKNQLGLLRAWLRATTSNDDAILVLKLGLYSPGWQQEWDSAVHRLQEEIGKRLDESAPLFVMHDILADYEMPGLYAAATHYISLSFGEGWDQPMFEAAASGCRLIAPDHSAYQAYLDRSTATLIPSHEVPAHFPGGGTTGQLFKHASWWAPDESAAVAAIRAAIDGRDAPGGAARTRVLRDFTWERTTEQLIAHLDEAQPGGGGRRGWLTMPWSRRRRA
jgi:glycosyltransferase involved in cell wall biosynthesis